MKTNEKYTVYASSDDITFIMQDTYVDGEYKSTEVIGFHYGEPFEKSIEVFSGKFKAEFYENEGDCK